MSISSVNAFCTIDGGEVVDDVTIIDNTKQYILKAPGTDDSLRSDSYDDGDDDDDNKHFANVVNSLLPIFNAIDHQNNDEDEDNNDDHDDDNDNNGNGDELTLNTLSKPTLCLHVGDPYSEIHVVYVHHMRVG